MKPKSKIASFFNTLFIDFHHLGPIKKIEKVVEKMSLSEKILFYSFSAIVGISSLVLVFQVNNYFLVEVPSFGGSFTEGLVGSPRFVNPVLAISDTDKDLVSLIYSGLLKSSEDGGFEPDLAASYEIKNGGLVYDFIIKDRVYFHDGKEVTADDVMFTIKKVLDPVIKSPKKSNWEGVTVEKVNDREVVFTLKKPYAPFISALTLGILPKHIWENVTSEEFPFGEFNIDPVGSGPYKVEKISKNSGGIPISITLAAWNKYALGRPKIKNIIFKFFQNEDALMKAYKDETIESAAGLSQTAANNMVGDKNLIDKASLPRVFGVFFNQNMAPVFLNKEIRGALKIATPKQKIVDEVLQGFGAVLNGPTPANVEQDSQMAQEDIESAKSLLADNGWKENEDGILEKKTKSDTTVFKFSITTSDAPELKKTAEILKNAWEKLGASVEVKIFEAGDLSQNVIKLRKYDALLFGEVVGEDSDLFPFWHSSERNDPGLNISLYANITVDKMLEEIQKETNGQEVMEKKDMVFSEIKADEPAIFLFSPQFLYLPSPKVNNIIIKDVSSQNERFISINKWFIETDKVWKFFTSNNSMDSL